MPNFVFMIRNSTLKRLPSEQGKKSDSTGSFQKKGLERTGSFFISKPKSGFAMARIVCLALVLSSCSYNLSPTMAQREQEKFERFKVSPTEAIIFSASGFAGYGLGKHFVQIKDK